MVLLNIEDAGDRSQVVLGAARGASLACLGAVLATITVVAVFSAVLAFATRAASAFAAAATSLGVVAVGKFDVQDGLDDAGLGFGGGLGALGGGQGQVERHVRGLNGALADRAAAARTARRLSGGGVSSRGFGSRRGLGRGRGFRGRGRGLLAGSGFLRGRSAGAVAQQLDQLGLAKLRNALETAGCGQSLELGQLHRRQRRGRHLGGGFVAHEVILTGMRPWRAR